MIYHCFLSSSFTFTFRIFRITRVLKLIRHSGRLILMIQVANNHEFLKNLTRLCKYLSQQNSNVLFQKKKCQVNNYPYSNFSRIDLWMTRTMWQVLLDCVYELAMLLVIWLMGVFIFGTIMFYIEHEQENTQFKSIMHSCWWSVVSMSTVCRLFWRTCDGLITRARDFSFLVLFSCRVGISAVSDLLFGKFKRQSFERSVPISSKE